MKLGFASRAVQLSSDKHNGVVVFTSSHHPSCYPTTSPATPSDQAPTMFRVFYVGNYIVG